MIASHNVKYLHMRVCECLVADMINATDADKCALNGKQIINCVFEYFRCDIYCKWKKPGEVVQLLPNSNSSNLSKSQSSKVTNENAICN